MPTGYDSDLAKKLNIKSGMTVRIIGKPADADLSGLPEADDRSAEGVLAFVHSLADADARAEDIVEAAGEGRVVWMAYPKAGKLGTDLNRDILWKHMRERGVDAVRQVALDDTWSAIRFKQAGQAS